MKTISLQSLALQGFRSFKATSNTCFPSKGMVLVKGDSGVGKSNFTQGIAFALDYCDKPATVLKTYNYQANWYARVELVLDGQSLISERGESAKLFYGSDVPGSIAQKKDKLSQLLGINTSLVKYLCYRPQRTFGLFLSMSDEAKKDFLGEILNTTEFDDLSKASSDSINSMEKELTDIANKQATVNGQMEVLSSTQAPIPSKERYESILADLDAKIKASDIVVSKQQNVLQQLSNLSNTKKKLLEELEKKAKADMAVVSATKVSVNNLTGPAKEIKDKIDSNNSAIDSTLTKLKVFDVSINSINKEMGALNRSIQAIKSEMALLEYKNEAALTELTTINATKDCSVCLAPLSDFAKAKKLVSVNELTHTCADLARQIRALESNLATTTAKLAQSNLEVTGGIKNRAIDQTRLDLLVAAKTALAKQLEESIQDSNRSTDAAIVAIQTEFMAARSKLEDANQDSMESFQQEVLGLNTDNNKLLSEIKDLQAELRAHEEAKTRNNAIDAKIQALSLNLKGLNLQAATLKANLDLERDVLSVVHKDGFPAYYFEDVLAEIAVEVNNVIQKVPNTSNLSFGFGDKINKTGKIRKNITPVVYLGGEAIPYTELSGGQRSVVEMASDLAIREVISRRCGVKFGWLVLDEIFNGMGKADKDVLLELLHSQVACDTLVLIIDHSVEYQDQFHSTINIINDHDGSKICTQ